LVRGLLRFGKICLFVTYFLQCAQLSRVVTRNGAVRQTPPLSTYYKQYPNKEYLCGEINEELVYFCQNLPNNLNEVLTKIKEILPTLAVKESFDDYVRNHKPPMEDKINFLTWYLHYNKNYSLRPGLFSIQKRFNPDKYPALIKDCLTFFENINYYCQDYKMFLNQVQMDEKALVFLDPPYLLSSVSFYNGGLNDKIWEFILDWIDNCKCKYIMVVDGSFFMKHLFKNKIIHEYSKEYQTTKRKVSHIVVSNIKNENEDTQ
jgi:site-specific DNA-adenine methylase